MTPTPNPEPQSPDAPEIPHREAALPHASSSRPASASWRARPVIVWPRYVKVLVLFAAASLLWLALELVWPTPAVPGLDMPVSSGDADVPTPSDGLVKLSEDAFAARKLFIPQVPVESREMSKATIDDMLSRMTISAMFQENGEYTAWVDVRDPSRSPERGGSTSSAATRTFRVKAGDAINDFTVEKIDPDGIDLSILTFKARLTF